MRLHLFDFDGTISKSDSMIDFLKFIHKSDYYLILLQSIPLLFKFCLKIISKKEFKSNFLLNFLSKFSKEELELKANEFVTSYEGHLKLGALKKIEDLKKNDNNEISIVSASLDIWIKPISDNLGINCIATLSNFDNNLFSGIKGENCWGEEKVARIKKVYKLKNYNEIYVYGDSKGDFQMLKIANHRRFKSFD